MNEVELSPARTANATPASRASFFSKLGTSRTAALVSAIPAIVVTLAFFGSRAIYYWRYGVRFDEFGIDFACQILDTELLQNDLLRSVFSLHHQTPALNLIIGLVFKLFPKHHGDGFALIYVTLGYGFALGLLSLFRSLGVGPIVRTVATVLFIISPDVLIYEWFINYQHLGAAFAVMAIGGLGLFLRTGGRPWGLAAFALMAGLTLTRSNFGLLWMLVVFGILLAYRPVPRRRIIEVAAIPLLFVFLYTLKTPLQTGRSFGHALLPANIVLKITHEIPHLDLERLYAEKKLSPISSLDPFFDITQHPEFRFPVRKTGIPALDLDYKKNGHVNPNSLQYVYQGDLYEKDAKWLFFHYNKTYWRSVWDALRVGYLRETTDVDYVPQNGPSRAIASVHDAVSKVMLKYHDRSWTLTLALPASFLWGLFLLIGPRAHLRSARSTSPLVAVMLFTILEATAMTLVSCGDYSRYRFDVDALYWVLFVLLLSTAAEALAASWRDRARLGALAYAGWTTWSLRLRRAVARG